MDRKRLESFNIKNILHAADSLFAEFGYVNTTMDKIAKLADYSKTTLYAYFRSKDEIFFTLMLERVLVLRDEFFRVVESETDFSKAYYKLCDLLVQMELDTPVYFEGMIGNINMRLDDDDTPAVYGKIFAASEDINQAIYKLLDLGVAEGKIAGDIDHVQLALYLWSSVTGVIRMTKQKNDYFLMKNITRDEMLSFAFGRILSGVNK